MQCYSDLVQVRVQPSVFQYSDISQLRTCGDGHNLNPRKQIMGDY